MIRNFDVNYRKPLLVVLLDAFFDCTASWDDFSLIIHALFSNSFHQAKAEMVGKEIRPSIYLLVPAGLKDYTRRISTTARHDQYAQSAISTLEAISHDAHTIQPIFENRCYFNDMLRNEFATSNLQDTCFIGLVLSHYTAGDSSISRDSKWYCPIHRDSNVQQNTSSIESTTSDGKKMQYKDRKHSKVATRLLLLCDYCNLHLKQSDIESGYHGPSLDFLYEGLKADFRIRIHSGVRKAADLIYFSISCSN
jgi:hypothetical protein